MRSAHEGATVRALARWSFVVAWVVGWSGPAHADVEKCYAGVNGRQSPIAIISVYKAEMKVYKISWGLAAKGNYCYSKHSYTGHGKPCPDAPAVPTRVHAQACHSEWNPNPQSVDPYSTKHSPFDNTN